MGESASVTDGRKLKGARRRTELIEATLRVVSRDGAAGVTHRTVAGEAGTTAGLTTYYFATLDDLLVAALSEVADDYTARIRRIIDADADSLRGMAELIAESAGADRERALAERELSTMAARRPVLRPVARRWRENVAELAARHTDDPHTVEAFVAVCDGLCAAILLENDGADVEHITAVLRSTLTGAR